MANLNSGRPAFPVSIDLNEAYGDDYADEFLGLLPATVAQLNDHADRQGLCTSYETAARDVHESVEGGYFTDTRTVTKRLRYWEAVPVEFGGTGTDADGDKFELVAVLPAFYRDKWVNGSFTETILKAVMADCYSAGGKPTMVILPPAQKVVFSTFPGIAAQRYQATGAKPTTII